MSTTLASGLYSTCFFGVFVFLSSSQAELRALPTPTLVARREDADVALRQWLETTSLPEDAVIF